MWKLQIQIYCHGLAIASSDEFDPRLATLHIFTGGPTRLRVLHSGDHGVMGLNDAWSVYPHSSRRKILSFSLVRVIGVQ